MVRIRLLTSVAAAYGCHVAGDAGDVIVVPDEVAAVWADGERAVRVEGERAVVEPPAPPVPPATTAERAVATGPQKAQRAQRGGRQW